MKYTDERDMSYDTEGEDAVGYHVLVQDIIHRLSSDTGTLLGYPDEGIDMLNWLHGSYDASELSRIKHTVEHQCVQDDRVIAASASVTYDRAKEELIIVLIITVDTGDLRLVLSVSGVTIELLSVQTT